MARVQTLLAIAIFIIGTSSAEDNEAEILMPNYRAMKVSELKHILEERGVKCEGCSEVGFFFVFCFFNTLFFFSCFEGKYSAMIG
jgi:hypothetical protein